MTVQMHGDNKILTTVASKAQLTRIHLHIYIPSFRSRLISASIAGHNKILTTVVPKAQLARTLSHKCLTIVFGLILLLLLLLLILLLLFIIMAASLV
jgi:hypothetical protein